MTGFPLTDDEVVVIATMAEGFWPSPLPTVDITDEQSLLLAALRGRRSLYVRSGGAEGGAHPGAEQIALAEELVGSERFVTVSILDADLTISSTAYVSVHYPGGDSWIVESISPAGVHELDRSSMEDQIAYLAEILEAVIDSADEDDVVALVGFGGDVSALAVKAGGVDSVQLAGGFQAEEGTRRATPYGVEDVLQRILAYSESGTVEVA